MRKDSENKRAKGGEDKGADPERQADERTDEERAADEAELKALREENATLRQELAAAEKRIAFAEERESQRGLTIHKRQEHVSDALVKPGRRLFLTADRKRLVPAGHEEAAVLYCTENDEVPRAEFEKLSAR